jgi:hypothetical protein
MIDEIVDYQTENRYQLRRLIQSRRVIANLIY